MLQNDRKSAGEVTSRQQRRSSPSGGKDSHSTCQQSAAKCQRRSPLGEYDTTPLLVLLPTLHAPYDTDIKKKNGKNPTRVTITRKRTNTKSNRNGKLRGGFFWQV